MTKLGMDERVTKYTLFANTLLQMANQGGLKNAVDLCKEKHIDTHFFAALVKKGHFFPAKGKKGKQYASSRPEHFTEQEVEYILKDMYLQAKMRGVNAPPQVRPTLSELGSPLLRLLSEYTPRELMDELKRRGYSGKLTFTKEIKF